MAFHNVLFFSGLKRKWVPFLRMGKPPYCSPFDVFWDFHRGTGVLTHGHVVVLRVLGVHSEYFF